MLAEELDYERFENRYKDKERIGAGGFGTVYKVFDHAKNHYVALKVSSVKPEWHKFTLKNEVELVNKMDKHRNIARYDACYRYNTGIAGEMDFAILKFYEDGNLEQFLNKQELGLYDKKSIIQGILEGVQFLHRNEVIHRDLKAQNILMSREDGVWCPKITDFGLSREVGSNETITNSAVGISYAYAAPEQILNQKIYRNVDLWATGVMIYRIISGELPFKGIDETTGNNAQSQFELSKNIVNVILPEKYESMPEPFKQMVSVCLVKDPKERVQSADVLLAMLHGKAQAPESMNGNVQAPPDLTDEATQLVQPKSTNPEESYKIPDYSPSPTLDTTTYQNPDRNVTQVFTPEPSREVEKVPEPEFPDMEGGERGGLNYRHLVIVGVLVLAVVAAIVAYTGIDRFDAKALPAYDGKLTPDRELVEDFSDLNLSTAEASDGEKVLSTLAAINREIDSGVNSENYRLHYFKAKLLVHQSQPKAAFGALEDAYGIAMQTGTGADLKKDMLADRELFKSVTDNVAIARTKWNRMLTAL
jgi:serine/threonine protein kinase